jgi:hypothetical protein
MAAFKVNHLIPSTLLVKESMTEGNYFATEPSKLLAYTAANTVSRGDRENVRSRVLSSSCGQPTRLFPRRVSKCTHLCRVSPTPGLSVLAARFGDPSPHISILKQ